MRVQGTTIKYLKLLIDSNFSNLTEINYIYSILQVNEVQILIIKPCTERILLLNVESCCRFLTKQEF